VFNSEAAQLLAIRSTLNPVPTLSVSQKVQWRSTVSAYCVSVL